MSGNLGTKIDRCCARIDSNRYFSLFDKHIRSDVSVKRVALIDISSSSVIRMIAERNPHAEYWIFDDSFMERTIKVYFGNRSIKYTYCPTKRADWKKEGADFPYNKYIMDKNVKFDIVVGNPPYDKSLHLKILKETMKYVDFDNGGEIIWLSPVRWLQDPIAKYNKNSALMKYRDVYNRMDSNEILNSDTGSDIFDIAIGIQLGVQHFKQHNKVNALPGNIIVDKVLNSSVNRIEDYIQFGRPMNYSCLISKIIGGNGRLESFDGTWMKSKNKAFFNNDLNADGKTYFEYRKSVAWGNVQVRAETEHIEFNTEFERENFYNSCNTIFYRYLMKIECVDVHVHTKQLPWMGEAVNPRTGLKGYQGEWTDEDFFDYFKLTDEERELVRKTMMKSEKTN